MNKFQRFLGKFFIPAGICVPASMDKVSSLEDLRRARERLKLSPREMAEGLGVSTETVLEWEKKKK